jgi:hypothetical protein
MNRANSSSEMYFEGGNVQRAKCSRFLQNNRHAQNRTEGIICEAGKGQLIFDAMYICFTITTKLD